MHKIVNRIINRLRSDFCIPVERLCFHDTALRALLAIEVVIFQALISAKVSNTPLDGAIDALAISMPTTAGYLFIRFTQEKHETVGYMQWMISLVMLTAEASGMLGILLSIMYISPFAGNIFAYAVFTMMFIFFICTSNYYFYKIDISNIMNYILKHLKKKQSKQEISKDDISDLDLYG